MAAEVVDVDFVDGLLWKPALEPHAAAGRRLLEAFTRQIKDHIGEVPYRTVAGIVGLGHSLLGGAYGEEIEAIASALDVSEADVVVANMAYDLANGIGCSTFVSPAPKGMLHARNLDWPFPGKLLERHTMVFRTAGASLGDYALVGWPGMFGGLTGLATGRFSVTVNFVHHAEASDPLAAVQRAASGYWPVAWLVRRAFDECRDFNAAVRLLSKEPILSPVLLTVAGPRAGEAVVIERGPDDYVQRAAERRCVLVTNHYVSPDNEECNVDLSDQDTEERLDFLEASVPGAGVRTVEQALEVLTDGTLASDITQHQAVMFPATGRLVVASPDGSVTEVEVETRDVQVECPAFGVPVSLEGGAGEYECEACGGDITLDEDGPVHEEMLEATCPEDGETVHVSAEEGVYECECGGDIYVEDGQAAHEAPVHVTCPYTKETYEYDEEGAWECPGCDATVEVEGDTGVHARIKVVSCPFKQGDTAVEVEEDATYTCPHCGMDIEVDEGRARHER